jgi:hypothetical protein
MKELGAEIDGEPLPSVVDCVRIAVTADLRSRLEKVDVVGVGKKVGRSHAARTGADDGHAVSTRARPGASGAAGRRGSRRGSVAIHQHRAGAERRQSDRALDDIPARH